LVAKLRPKLAAQMQTHTGDNQGAELVSAQRRVAALDQLEKVTAQEVERLSKGTKSLNQNSLNLESIQDEIALADGAAKTIGQEIEALNVELQAPPRIRQLSKAEEPRARDDRLKLKMTGMTGASVFGLVVFLICYWEAQARRINSLDEVVQQL